MGHVGTLQISVDSHRNMATEASRGEIRCLRERQKHTYRCVKLIAVVTSIYFVASRIAFIILSAIATTIRIVANDNNALVGALGSELATIGTGRVRCDVRTINHITSRVRCHLRRVLNGSRKLRSALDGADD